jgi:hypothetical protein
MLLIYLPPLSVSKSLSSVVINFIRLTGHLSLDCNYIALNETNDVLIKLLLVGTRDRLTFNRVFDILVYKANIDRVILL